jgi:hypothetical protein
VIREQLRGERQASRAQLVLTELGDTVYDQLTCTKTIRLIGTDRVYSAEPKVFVATRRAVLAAQKQIGVTA